MASPAVRTPTTPKGVESLAWKSLVLRTRRFYARARRSNLRLGGDQARARAHPCEAHRTRAGLDGVAAAPDAHVGARVQVAGRGEVAAEMRAARVAARERRGGDHRAHLDQAVQVQPVVPGDI